MTVAVLNTYYEYYHIIIRFLLSGYIVPVLIGKLCSFTRECAFVMSRRINCLIDGSYIFIQYFVHAYMQVRCMQNVKGAGRRKPTAE